MHDEDAALRIVAGRVAAREADGGCRQQSPSEETQEPPAGGRRPVNLRARDGRFSKLRVDHR
jgi:hypothetical protein